MLNRTYLNSNEPIVHYKIKIVAYVMLSVAETPPSVSKDPLTGLNMTSLKL